MTTALFILLPIFLLATLGALGVGIYSLLRGGEFAQKHSNRMMRLRVLFQSISIMLVVLIVWLGTRGG